MMAVVGLSGIGACAETPPAYEDPPDASIKLTVSAPWLEQWPLRRGDHAGLTVWRVNENGDKQLLGFNVMDPDHREIVVHLLPGQQYQLATRSIRNRMRLEDCGVFFNLTPVAGNDYVIQFDFLPPAAEYEVYCTSHLWQSAPAAPERKLISEYTSRAKITIIKISVY